MGRWEMMLVCGHDGCGPADGGRRNRPFYPDRSGSLIYISPMAAPTIAERFPPLPLSDVIALVQQFPTATSATRQATIRTLVASHPIASYDWGGAWRYRRARLVEAGQVLSQVSELIWRADQPAIIGRANSAGFPVLYLADRRDTALSEIHLDVGEVVLTEFRIRPDRATRVAPIGDMATVQRTGRSYLAGRDAAPINDLINACAPDAARSMLIVDAFLLSCLVNTEDDYALSSSVAMAVFEKLPDIAAVAFPSRRQTGAVNFAVRHDAVWRDWGIVSVRAAHARLLAMGYYDLSNVRHVTGITTAGALVWDDAVDDQAAVQLLDPPWYPRETVLSAEE